MQPMNFNDALIYAKSLPTHTDGKLNHQFESFDKENKMWFSVIYEDDPLSVFRSLRIRRLKLEKGFIYETGGKLLYHVPYSRQDTKVKAVSFDIIGVKRQTTHLPAGVMINNVKFTV